MAWPCQDRSAERCILPAVRLVFPNSAHLQNIEGFISKSDPTGPGLEICFHPRWVSVHPVVIAIAACAAARARAKGEAVTLSIPNRSVASLRYLQRMGLFEITGTDPGLSQVEHESAGRFIPLACIATGKQLSSFLVDMIPLLHVDPDHALPIKYVISELVRNVHEHSSSQEGAFLCAQYYKDSNKLALGVADAGVGIRTALGLSYPTPDDLAAILLALRPGVTGTTTRLGGGEDNAGAGLFFTKSIAAAGNTFMCVYSGDALFKLLTTPKGKQIVIYGDPRRDRCTTKENLPVWSGTAIGIDIGLAHAGRFNQLLDEISRVYNIDLRQRKAAKFKKPRFT